MCSVNKMAGTDIARLNKMPLKLRLYYGYADSYCVDSSVIHSLCLITSCHSTCNITFLLDSEVGHTNDPGSSFSDR